MKQVQTRTAGRRFSQNRLSGPVTVVPAGEPFSKIVHFVNVLIFD